MEVLFLCKKSWQLQHLFLSARQHSIAEITGIARLQNRLPRPRPLAASDGKHTVSAEVGRTGGRSRGRPTTP